MAAIGGAAVGGNIKPNPMKKGVSLVRNSFQTEDKVTFYERWLCFFILEYRYN